MSEIAETPRELTRHRATYTLELGVWYATCRSCGHRVDDLDRRRAAAQFRQHIQQMSDAETDLVVELRSVAEVEPSSVSTILSMGSR